MNNALDILQQYWGYDSFRKKQDEIIQSVLDRKDILALLPTGGGKSICYQVPGLMKEGVCLVITPLIALMQDQVAQLKKRKISAVALHSGLHPKEIDILLDNAIYGQTKFLFVSPERLKSRLFLQRFDKMNINLIAVDEAHCISEWGYDFRPAYREIALLRERKPELTVLALTATATPEVVDDIQNQLAFSEEHVIRDSFARPNIAYNVLQSNNKMNRILEYLHGRQDSGIIYCSTRKQVKTVCKDLLEKGISANFYHGGLEADIRSKRQTEWIKGETKIMVCTNAFGMGIDKPDVRFVLHYDIPETIEAYFQEAGRAGRDGKTAETQVFYEPADIDRLREKIALKYPVISFIKRLYHQLGNYFQIAIGSGKEERYTIDLLDFCDRYELELIATFNGLKFLEISGYISLSENFSTPSTIHIITDNQTIYQFQVRDHNINKVIQFILRTQMGVFDHPVKINEDKIAKYTKLSKKEVVRALGFLHQQEAVVYVPQSKGSQIYYITERLPENNLHIPTELYHKRKKLAESKCEAMIGFLQTGKCSSEYLLNYFGQKNTSPCGICVNCMSEEHSNTSSLSKALDNYLTDRLEHNKIIVFQSVISDFPTYSKDQILDELRLISDRKKSIQLDPVAKTIKKI